MSELVDFAYGVSELSGTCRFEIAVNLVHSRQPQAVVVRI